VRKQWGPFLLIACLSFAAYLPALSGEFVYDDERFIEKNPAVTQLTAANAVRYFTDPTSQSIMGHDIYRPLRTLEFAVDWAISGGRPWFFHLRSVLWHALASLLLYAVLRRLLEADLPALFGTLAFALHPVNTEAVAWITSRGDVLLLAWFLLALLLYLRGRPLLAAFAFVGALLSKETAVFFPAAVLMVDLFRRADRRWVWYGVYGAMAVVFVAVWFYLVAGAELENVRHLKALWGGSYSMTVLTMAKGFLHYARVIAFPVHFTVDYHVPTSTGLGLGEVVALVVLAAIVAAAVAAGPRSRLALAWFFLALLPVSNLIRPIGIPTAERFLYLPLVGVALWAGPVLGRYRRLTVLVLVCLFVLTFQRSRIWRTEDALWHAAERVAPTPRGLEYRARKELQAAHAVIDLKRTAAPDARGPLEERVREHASATVRYVDGFFDLYADVIRLPPSKLAPVTLGYKANALLLLGRPSEALREAEQAIRLGGSSLAYLSAALAAQDLGIWDKAASYLQTAHDMGFGAASFVLPDIGNLWLRAAVDRERAGDRAGALERYRRSWKAFPDPVRNRPALEAIRRLGG
jgi:tetratricopeptide (TPR) repeat protein